jgi:hypothetical protein
VVVIQVNREDGRWEDVRHLPCRYFTSHGHMPGHRHWWCLLYYVAVCGVWCVVWSSEPPNGGPFLRQSISFYPYLAVLRVQSGSRAGAKLACHTSFISWLCGLLYGFRTQTELSARGFIEGFLGGIDSVVWCGWLIVFIGRVLSTTQSHDPSIGAVRLNTRTTPNPLMGTRC